MNSAHGRDSPGCHNEASAAACESREGTICRRSQVAPEGQAGADRRECHVQMLLLYDKLTMLGVSIVL